MTNLQPWLERVMQDLDGRERTAVLDAATRLSDEYEGDLPRLREHKEIRQEMAIAGLGQLDFDARWGGQGLSFTAQLCLQFSAGYISLEARDVADLGHARLIMLGDNENLKEKWAPRLRAGAIVAFAATEPAGGTSILHTVSTNAVRVGNSWFLSGEKAWISRTIECDAIVVLHKMEGGPDLGLSVVAPDAPGLTRELREPIGLKSTSWSDLCFREVELTKDDLISVGGAGSVFRTHFARYRQIVAALCLGAAARATDSAVATLRNASGASPMAERREQVVDLTGRMWADVYGASSWLWAAGSATAGERFAKAVKATAVEVALRATRWDCRVQGAAAFEEGHPARERLHAVEAYEYADGTQDALWRSVGRSVLGAD